MLMRASTKFLLRSLALPRLPRVVDVGANPLSRPPYYKLMRMNGCDVYGFEPNRDAFAKLQESKTDRETYFPHAVGDGSERDFYLYRSSGLSSTLKPYEGAFRYLGRSRKNMTVRETLRVQTKRLDDMPELPDFELLKIDIQGGEVAVFEGGKRCLSNALVVIPEVRFYQIYEDEPMFGGIDTALRAAGFQLLKIYATKTRIAPNSQQYSINRPVLRSQMLDGDAVYIRDLGKVDLYTEDQLIYLAVLASGVFDAHDVTLFCLDELVARGAVPARLPEEYVNTFPPEMRETPEMRKEKARRAAETG
ncbi:hypothetical protein AIOL_001839 [Candidatus Rhodobacter oscarellae]|uniref:Methyltransferase FkbM domain-containing protein n=1 Tax=Candidatus Rhodobacter oscarellae TaxID=1675527 RepID=A0A0J9E2G7_9RHOB|nr:FkbM family methyltransferase [Candidatus Rhodobacter lobularis]KMW56882.1 hypothetical protein AIOL_001839 [Candidatus Rhodobacter lobularis]